MNLEEKLDGYQVTCLILAAVQSGLLERLHTEPVSMKAALAGFDYEVGTRVLSALQAHGLVGFTSLAGSDVGAVYLTNEGHSLLEGNTLNAKAKLIAAEYLPSWLKLSTALEAGGIPSQLAFGINLWEQRLKMPAEHQAFALFMGRTTKAVSEAFVSSFAFRFAKRIATIGGGDGDLLIRILRKATEAEGINVDVFPDELVEPIRKDFAQRAGNVGDRATFVNGDFFDSVNVPTADMYVAQYVFHDWDDEHCIALINVLREKALPGGKLVIIESMRKDPMKDLQMLVLHGGKDRTTAELQDLIVKAGLHRGSTGVAGGIPFVEVVLRGVEDEDDRTATLPIAGPAEGAELDS